MARADRPILRVLAAALLTAASLGLRPAPARADKASAKLAKHNARVDQAVDRGLEWLAKNQDKTGWFAGGYGKTNAVVGLATMAFLAKGYTPGRGKYGDELNRCIDYILTNRRRNGSLDAGHGGGGMYSHCISTLVLSEVSGMVDPDRQKKIDKVLPNALKLILQAQRVKKNDSYKGGWRYKFTSRNSDISVSGWALMALRSARLNGARVPDEAIKDAMGFFKRCQRPDGQFGYTPRGSGGLARTGVGLLALELTGEHDSKLARKAGDSILRHIRLKKSLRTNRYYYAVYYCSQGMFQLGGEYWETYAEKLFDDVISKQQADGRWQTGSYRAYSTSMCVLSLSVVYRQLPIYQR
jgi:hypothetical protein